MLRERFVTTTREPYRCARWSFVLHRSAMQASAMQGGFEWKCGFEEYTFAEYRRFEPKRVQRLKPRSHQFFAMNHSAPPLP